MRPQAVVVHHSSSSLSTPVPTGQRSVLHRSASKLMGLLGWVSGDAEAMPRNEALEIAMGRIERVPQACGFARALSLVELLEARRHAGAVSGGSCSAWGEQPTTARGKALHALTQRVEFLPEDERRDAFQALCRAISRLEIGQHAGLIPELLDCLPDLPADKRLSSFMDCRQMIGRLSALHLSALLGELLPFIEHLRPEDRLLQQRACRDMLSLLPPAQRSTGALAALAESAGLLSPVEAAEEFEALLSLFDEARPWRPATPWEATHPLTHLLRRLPAVQVPAAMQAVRGQIGRMAVRHQALALGDLVRESNLLPPACRVGEFLVTLSALSSLPRDMAPSDPPFDNGLAEALEMLETVSERDLPADAIGVARSELLAVKVKLLAH